MTAETLPVEWQPTATREALQQRACLMAGIRNFFHEQGVLEVETPTLSQAGNSDPGMEQIATREGRWLRTSPEYALKRLLAAGQADLYELGRVFRAGESGPWHNPEFTLLEWYRLDWDYPRLMDEVAALVNHCGRDFNRQWKIRHVTYQTWLKTTAKIDPLEDSLDDIRHRIREAGIATDGLETLDRDGWLDLAVTHLAQPALADDAITLVSLYPASQAALARIHPDDPRVAERFEVFVGGVELANGYQELTDAGEQRSRFEQENRYREARGQPAVPLDHRLLSALEAGLPHCSGIALGVDRLLMILGGYTHMRDVLAFPAERA